ncbi:MAG: response regulator, partial [Candidatus Hodarchaeales archaeon]
KGERDKRIKVMTVEDDKDTQRMYRMILEKYDINIVSEAFDGREAIEKFRELEEKPGVILLDYNLVTVVRGRT